jgi:hypothetical protein
VAARAAESSPIKMGEAAQTDTFKIVVTSVKKATGWTKSPPANFEYVIVALQITNISGKNRSISASDFGCVKDDSGNRASWENYTGVKTDPDTFGAKEIEPGQQFSGSVIFALPIEMKTTELHYTKGYSAKPNLRFEITK